MFGLGALGFANPWFLGALLLLPLLWWLLRITPPAAQNIRFPVVRLLLGLETEEQTPQASPLWLILLRILTVTALILGLAGPLLNPRAALPGGGPLLLVVDDGWAAARHWPRRKAAMEEAIDRAAREDRTVYILPTVPPIGGGAPALLGPLRTEKARNIVAALLPKPWSADRAGAVAALKNLSEKGAMPVYWLSNGLTGEKADALADRLRRLGTLVVLADPPADLPSLLHPPESRNGELRVALSRAATGAALILKLRGRATDGRALIERSVAFAADENRVETTIDVPRELRNKLSRLEIDGNGTAGGVILLDERWRRRSVGVAAAKPLDSGPALLSETYYIERALQPFSDVLRAPIAKLVDSGRSVIAVPDTEPLDPAARAALDKWIRRGGVVLRFAGLKLAARQDDALTPVPLRRGGRTLGGALLWSEPARLAPFNEKSPFFGLVLPKDVSVSRQVLAQPSLDLASKTWARLTDGTPLVTASRRGEGWLVLVHTTASTAWTNLPLSGLFVEMLQRIVGLGRGLAGGGSFRRPLAPFKLLDGFGRLGPPSPRAQAIDSAALRRASAGPATPPGFYGTESTRRALNLSPGIKSLKPLGSLPSGIARQAYLLRAEVDFQPWLLLLTFVLALADMMATLALRGLLPHRRLTGRAGAAILLAAGLTAALGDAQAQTKAERFALDSANATRLAFIVTGDRNIDDVSRSGLTGLSDRVRRRTAAELAPPVGVNPATDELAFFALLYWPIHSGQEPLPPAAIRHLNRYMENGGTIFFDTREGDGGTPHAGVRTLRRLTRGLNIPPLVSTPPSHVLTKAFYLMQDFPGRWAGGRLWVEASDRRAKDGVSRVLIGSHDWAAAWSIDSTGRPLFAVVPGGEKQREMAFRFGINLVMYALTGNYKADQVHVPAILERLGQ